MEYNRAYFKDKACAVTGGASGIGLALCEELLECGASSVVLADYNEQNLRKHEERLLSLYPGRVKGVLCNVTKEDEVRRMVDAAAALGGGRLDLLINCAGAAFAGYFTEASKSENVNSTLKVQTNESWRNAFALNFYGALYGCRAAIPLMVSQRSGQIINIISGIAFSPMAYQSMYAATKAALCTLSLALRYEYWDEGIRISAATPGTTATAIFSGSQTPPEAQSPQQSASRILNGVAQNARLILGDDSDLSGSKVCFYPDDEGRMVDEVFKRFARLRRSGALSFAAKVEAFTPSEPELWQELSKIPSAPGLQGIELAKRYVALRKPFDLDAGYYAGKTAAVTGAAGGVGFALCEKLLACGASKVVMADVNEERLTAQTERLCARYPGKVKRVVCDVAREESVQAMIEEALAFFGGTFDLLINCAGIAQRGLFVSPPDGSEALQDIGDVTSQETWERVFDVNFYGPLFACRAVLPTMIDQKRGQIVNIISGTAFMPLPYEGVYAAAKSALNLLTLALRYEYEELGVQFNSATPGAVATALFGDVKPPKNAQSPEDSATRILTGVAKNDRLVCGSDDDIVNAMFCYNDEYRSVYDELELRIARARRHGDAGNYGD